MSCLTGMARVIIQVRILISDDTRAPLHCIQIMNTKYSYSYTVRLETLYSISNVAKIRQGREKEEDDKKRVRNLINFSKSKTKCVNWFFSRFLFSVRAEFFLLFYFFLFNTIYFMYTCDIVRCFVNERDEEKSVRVCARLYVCICIYNGIETRNKWKQARLRS